MIQKRSYRLFSVLSLLVAMMMVLAACGDPAATATTVPSTQPAASATAPSGGAATATVPAGGDATATTAPAVDATATPAPQPAGNVLRIHQYTFPEVLDPQKSSFTHEISVISMLYEGLTKLNDKLEIVPAAAESWTFSEDASVVTFKMRSGLKYSDGSPLTAKDYERAIRRTLSSGVAGEYQYILFDIKGAVELAGTPMTDTAALEAADTALGVSAPDDSTLVITLNGPAPYFPAIASLWVLYPVKESSTAAGESWHLDPKNHVGNGPFTLQSMDQDSRMVFGVNANYWGGKPKIDGMEYIYIKDSSNAFEAYKQGQVDIFQPDPSQLPAIEEDSTLSPQLLKYPQAATSTFNFNLTKKPFDDPKVRQAFTQAFDRDTWCEVIRNGDCVGTLSWIPEGIGGFYEETRFAFDPAAAKAALAESTYGGPEGLPEIEFAYSSDNAATKPRVEWIAGEWLKHLGVQVKLAPYEGATLVSMRKDVATFPHVTGAGWIGDYPDPQNWLSVNWASTSDQAMDVGYKNEELDAIITQADRELDPTKRMSLYVDGGKLLVGDVPTIFSHNPANVFLVKPNVTGYTPTASDSEWPGQWASQLSIAVAR